MDNLDISVIIPTFHFEDSVRKVILALNEQSVRVNEVIIVDSSTNDGVKEVVQGFKEHQDNNINYIRRDKAYPGEARNIGAKIAKGEWLAFVDSKTVPERNWFEESLKEIEEKELDVLFGVTQYHAKSKFQKLLRAASFGEVGHETTPGSMIKKELFLNSNFSSDLRKLFLSWLPWRNDRNKEDFIFGSNLIIATIPIFLVGFIF